MVNRSESIDDLAAQEKKVEAWHQILNSDSEVPPRWYRRNAVEYELICYINNIIGCYLAHNYEAIPIFIQRCRRFLSRYTIKEKDIRYFEYISEYLLDLEALMGLYMSKNIWLAKNVNE